MTDDRVREEHPDMNPMIDIVFQLLIFFLVTMKFKTLDMKIDAFLPTNRGLGPDCDWTPPPPTLKARLLRSRSETAQMMQVHTLDSTAKRYVESCARAAGMMDAP